MNKNSWLDTNNISALNANEPSSIESIYKKVINGDSITDEEVNRGVQFFEDLSIKLGECGSIFSLACNEARRIYFTLHSYKLARERKD